MRNRYLGCIVVSICTEYTFRLQLFYATKLQVKLLLHQMGRKISQNLLRSGSEQIEIYSPVQVNFQSLVNSCKKVRKKLNIHFPNLTLSPSSLYQRCGLLVTMATTQHQWRNGWSRWSLATTPSLSSSTVTPPWSLSRRSGKSNSSM